MRIKTYALSTLAISGILVAAFGFYQNQGTPSYQPKKSIAFENAVGRFDIAIEYNKLLKGDPVTGEINPKHVIASRNSVKKALSRDSKADPMGLIWSGLGPDNVGGRTRAIVIDRNNPNIMLAGGVAGGVYVSFDASQSWKPRMGGTNLTIGAMAQTANGYYYIGTGPLHDGSPGGTSNSSDNSMGDGLYRIKTVYDEYEHLVSSEEPGNQDWDGVYEMVAHPSNPDVLFVATGGGLYVSRDAGNDAPTFTKIGQSNGIQGNPRDVDITPDGNTIIAVTNSRVWRSTDGGNSFELNFAVDGASRIECAISPTDGNFMYLSTVRNGGGQENGCLHRILQSSDGGDTWNVIASGVASGTTATFDPFANPGTNCQGNYDNAIAVFPDDPGKILVGGIQLWQGELLPGSSPPAYGWTQVATTNGGPGSIAGVYVHADKHRILIPDANTIYVGSDGGIAKSTDGGNLWLQNNLGYRVTQFYSLAIVPQFVGPDLVMGGTQDNGTLLIGAGGENNATIANEVQGGDGFDCEFSSLSTSAFATSQNGSVRRVEQSGTNSGTFWDDELEGICGGGSCGPFYTTIEYWESRNADVTFDSVLVKADTNYAAGDSIGYLSLTNGVPTGTILSSPLAKGDSTMLPDHVQSRFVFANLTSANALYMTQDAPNLTVTVPEWSRIADDTSSYPDRYSGQTFTLEFSPDGNHLFIGTLGGSIFRISNLLYAHDSLTSDIRSSSCVLTCTRIASAGGVVTGIASDPSNIDHLVITVGGYDRPNSVYRITNATQALSNAGNLTSIQGDLPSMPVFDAEIDVSNPDIVLVGTEFGVWATKNASSGSPEWTDENQGMPRIPAYEIKQQRSNISSNGVFATTADFNYKTYYVATHGGGFFKTNSLVGIDDPKVDAGDKFKSTLKLYPNPVKTNSFLEFKLPSKAASRLMVYNLKGQLVQERDLGTLPAGSQKINLETSLLSAGTYILRLEAGSYSDVTKFIKSE